jgi:hypothetical protein
MADPEKKSITNQSTSQHEWWIELWIMEQLQSLSQQVWWIDLGISGFLGGGIFVVFSTKKI